MIYLVRSADLRFLIAEQRGSVMQLFEHEAKEILAREGVLVPRSCYVSTAEQALESTARIGPPVVLKAQTLVKGRGKAGLVRLAYCPSEAARVFEELVGRSHEGPSVSGVLIEEKIPLVGEIFLSITVDCPNASPLLLVGLQGGVEVETILLDRPEFVKKVHFSPAKGLKEAQIFEVLDFVANAMPEFFGVRTRKQLEKLIRVSEKIFKTYDCELLEINPLGIADDLSLVVIDALMVIDDDAEFRHPDLVRPRGQSQQDFQREQEFKKKGWTFIPMGGEIGILSSGAGITMAILDLIHLYGGKPANFLDTAQMDRRGIYEAFQIFHTNTNTTVLLVNIFAGLNRCDDLALGIVDYLRDFQPPFPIVVRMIGNKDEEGRRILREHGLEPLVALEEAVLKAIEKLRG